MKPTRAARPFAPLALIALGMLLGWHVPARAQAALSVTPITWNVIGLDSNDVNTGPQNFPVGARVCNTGNATATNVMSAYVWDDGAGVFTSSVGADTYINLRDGTLSAHTTAGVNLAPAACTDFYYEVTVNRLSSAYTNTRDYHITASADGPITGSTPVPRELYVERLVSQSRNSINTLAYKLATDVSYTTVGAGGSLNLVVGQTYDIRLSASTATQGYEQLETFINFPNTIFQITDVDTEYSAFTPGNQFNDTLYEDGCGWINDPNDPNYRACTGTGKNGGTITIVYRVAILSLPPSPFSNPDELQALVHDFSGSSFHYNSNFDANTWFFNIVDPGISKVFVPNAMTPTSTTQLRITITNPTTSPLTGVNFTDPLPSSPGTMSVATPLTFSTLGCGSPTFAPTIGATTLNFSNGTIAASSSCLITVNVTAPSNGVYTNTTGNLFINGTTPGTGINTGNFATATLTVAANVVACTNGTMARWSIPTTTTASPPDLTGGVPSLLAGDVASATLTALDTTDTSNGGAAVETTGGQGTAPDGYYNTWGYSGFGQYIQFAVNTANYQDVALSFYVKRDSPGPTSALTISTSTDGTNFTSRFTPANPTTTWQLYGPFSFTGFTSTTGITYFRITATGANNNNKGAGLQYDLMTFTGCSVRPPPTIIKSFATSPIQVGNTSALTLTVSNTSVTPAAIPLTAVNFSDTLPSGLLISSLNAASSTCDNSPFNGTISAPGGGSTISLSNTSMAAPSSCTVVVNVTGAAAGVHLNVSDRVGSFESGQNLTSTGFATDTLVVIGPPVVTKAFAASPIFVGNNTTLTITIANPNISSSLTGVAFTDTYPGGFVNASPSPGATNSCGGSLTATAGVGSISLSGVTLGASASCTVTVNVTGTSAGSWNNSVTVTTTNGGSSNPADDTLVVTTPDPPSITILKQIRQGTSGTWFDSIAVPAGATNLYYQFTIENTGGSDLSPVSITDGTLAPFTCTPALPATLEVADMSDNNHIATCVVGPYTASSTPAIYTNTATAHGFVGATEYTDTDTASYAIASLSLDKSVPSGTYYVNAGEVITYNFNVTNNGFFALQTPLAISDPQVGTINCPAISTVVPDGDNFLDPNETVPCTATYTVSATDISNGSIVNTAQSTMNTAELTPDLITSNPDQVTVNKVPANFGHLPIPTYAGFNKFVAPAGGGARHLTGSSYLGDLVATEADGIDSPTFTSETEEDGAAVTFGFPWTESGGGSVDIAVTCASTCYLSAWIDWNHDGDFNDTSEQIIVPTTSVSTGTATYTFPIPSGALSGGNTTLYARVRLYESTTGLPTISPVGVAGFGEVEDYALPLVGVEVTPVTLASFEAKRVGHRIRFEWSTSTEAGNIGFDIYAEDAHGRRKLTTQPVPSRKRNAIEPQDYVLEVSADVAAGTVFYVEDIDHRGKRRSHGPFSIEKLHGRKPRPERIDWETVRADRGRKQKQRDGEALAIMAAAGPNATRANLLVSADGIHRVTHEELLAAGFNFGGATSRDIALVNKGVAVAIEVTGGTKFGAGSAILFHGTALDTIYTDQNVYTLSVDKKFAKRVATDATIPGAGTPAASYTETAKVDNDYAFDTFSPVADPWYDTFLYTFTSPVSQSFDIELDDVASLSPASLAVTMYGASEFDQNPDHHVVVKVNGTTVANRLFDGSIADTPNVSLPSGLIHAGSNSMTLEMPADTGAEFDGIVLDRYSITYPRQFLARDGRLSFTATGSLFLVDRLPTSNVVVYRLNAGQVTRLTGAQVQATANGYSVRFPGSGQSATYVVSALASALTAGTAVPNAPSGLTSGPAQLLVITHPDFKDNLGPLVSARQSEGLSVKVVDVNDVLAQYGHSIFDPEAIRTYIKYAASNMGTHYVLFVGGDMYDYRNFLGYGGVSFVPTLYSATDAYSFFSPADSLFGDLNNDNVPDIAVGRLPVRTTEQLDTLIGKILAYKTKNYAKTAVFSSDADDADASYQDISNSFAAGLPPGWSVQQAHVNDLGIGGAHNALIAAMNAGVAVTNFIGHSDLEIWTFNGLFSSADAAALTNNGRPFFAAQYGCWNTYYVSPFYETLGHALLLSGDQGAAGVMGGVTLTEVDSDELLGLNLVPAMTTPGTRLGDAIIAAKQAVAATTSETDTRSVIVGWALLGDPTMVIQPQP